ncbi:unnamed protein product [Ixodes pacificus]
MQAGVKRFSTSTSHRTCDASAEISGTPAWMPSSCPASWSA